MAPPSWGKGVGHPQVPSTKQPLLPPNLRVKAWLGGEDLEAPCSGHRDPHQSQARRGPQGGRSGQGDGSRTHRLWPTARVASLASPARALPALRPDPGLLPTGGPPWTVSHQSGPSPAVPDPAVSVSGWPQAPSHCTRGLPTRQGPRTQPRAEADGVGVQGRGERSPNVERGMLTASAIYIIAPQAPLSMGFSRQEHWSGLPCPPPGDLPNPGMKPGSPALQTDSLPLEPPEKPLDNGDCSKHFMCQLF